MFFDRCGRRPGTIAERRAGQRLLRFLFSSWLLILAARFSAFGGISVYFKNSSEGVFLAEPDVRVLLIISSQWRPRRRRRPCRIPCRDVYTENRRGWGGNKIFGAYDAYTCLCVRRRNGPDSNYARLTAMINGAEKCRGSVYPWH